MKESFSASNAGEEMHESDNPHFSIIIPLYNKGRWIARTLDTLDAQSERDFEFIVIDDGSTDDGPAIVAARLGAHGRLIRRDNRGPSAARNLGIMYSRGRYICFLDADDEYHPHYLATMRSLIDRFPEAGMYACGYRIRFPEGEDVERFLEPQNGAREFIVRDFFRKRSFREFACMDTTIVPRTTFARIGLFRARGYDSGEDTNMWYRIALSFPVAYVSTVLNTYHQGIAGQITRPTRKFRLQDFHGKNAIFTLEEGIRDARRSVEERAAIRDVQKILYFEAVRNSLRKGTAEATRYWIEDVFGDARPPLFSRAAATPLLRPLAKAWLAWKRMLGSRRFLRLRGGAVRRHGVVERLARRP